MLQYRGRRPLRRTMPLTGRAFVLQVLNGISFGALLFLLSSGFQLIFGLMRIVNLAHGSFYLVGGYIGLSVLRASGNFWLAVGAAALGVAAIGLVVELGLLRRLRGQAMPEVLLTVGLSLVFAGAFTIGALLAGIAGIVGGVFLGLYPGADGEILLFALVVVILGGLGSLQGAMIGSLLVGLIDAFGRELVPSLSYFLLFAPMALVLIFRPRGLFGKTAS